MELSKNVAQAEISGVLSRLHKPVFSPKGNNNARKRDTSDERLCGSTFKIECRA